MIPNNIVKSARYFALNSNCRFRLGAVLFSGKRVFSGGFNDNRTHPKSNVPFKTLHAEFAATISFKQDTFRDVSLYVHRLKKNGSQGLAKPCVHCTSMLKHLGLKAVYYSTEVGIERL